MAEYDLTTDETFTTDEQLRSIFVEHFGVNQTDGATEASDPGYKAYALLGIDVAMRIANIFLALKGNKPRRIYRAICDLTYELNTNSFWQKNASVILPLIHAALNTYRDADAFLQQRKAGGDTYSSTDTLLAGTRTAALEIFPVIAYLVGGPPLMVQVSAPLKTALAPYFLR